MLHILPVAAFSDNYIWLLSDENKKYAAIVDPGDANVTIEALTQYEMQPIAILITHHHADHVGGIEALLQKYPDLPVYGPANESIPFMTHPLTAENTVKLEALDANLQVLDIPGHTAGHIAYYHEDEVEKRLFCGDTLFANGCGRVLGGTLHDLHHSLQQIAALPPETLIYCAHEYTLDNIGFAKWVEPDNQALLAHEQTVFKLMDANKPSIPTSLQLEKSINPFLRVNQKSVISAVEKYCRHPLANSTEVFSVLRTWKDRAYD